MTIESKLMTAIGISGTVGGSLEIAQGNVLEGAEAVLLGMTCTNIGGRLDGMNPRSHAKLMKWTLGAGTGVVGVQGAVRLRNGVKQKNASEIIKGGIQTLTGIVGTAFVYSLDSKIIVIAHQASVLALTGTYIAKLGLYDLVKGRIRPGLYKILFGAGAIASTGHYLYSTCKSLQNGELSAEHIAFLDSHQTEIEEMYEYKTPSGKWTKLGSGVSKTAFVHPDIPGMLIKIPNGSSGFRGTNGEDDLRIHHSNLEEIRSIAVPFDRIALPESHLIDTSKGLMIVEQRFDLAEYLTVPDGADKQEAMDQFEAFQREADLCDLIPSINHNAGFIDKSAPSKIGIIDFDCRISQLGGGNIGGGNWDWNFRNPGSKFFAPQNRNQVGVLVLASGTAVLGGVSTVAKKISGINPKRVLQFGLVAGALATTYISSLDGPNQPFSTMVGTGLALAATSVISASLMKTYSWVKNKFVKASPTASIAPAL